ncbi:hypothetical protein JMJ77_0013694, partial [Colletotrichum scovillei]
MHIWNEVIYLLHFLTRTLGFWHCDPRALLQTSRIQYGLRSVYNSSLLW